MPRQAPKASKNHENPWIFIRFEAFSNDFEAEELHKLLERWHPIRLRGIEARVEDAAAVLVRARERPHSQLRHEVHGHHGAGHVVVVREEAHAAARKEAASAHLGIHHMYHTHIDIIDL